MCLGYNIVFLFDDWKSKSIWKLDFEAIHYPKNGLWENIFPDLTDKEMSDELTKTHYYGSILFKDTLKVWNESVKSTKRNKVFIFEPN